MQNLLPFHLFRSPSAQAIHSLSKATRKLCLLLFIVVFEDKVRLQKQTVRMLYIYVDYQFSIIYLVDEMLSSQMDRTSIRE